MKSQNIDAYLKSFPNYEINLNDKRYAEFSLARIRYFLKKIGDPQKQLFCVHVAGSKGKGSTCALTAHILAQAGYRAGLYTSPHLYRVNERIRILIRTDRQDSQARTGPDARFYGDEIPTEHLAHLLDELKPLIEEVRETEAFGFLTYFELITALAFSYFQQQKVDIVLLETGLGGRFDATNVVDAKIA